jgi:hypothetical protein
MDWIDLAQDRDRWWATSDLALWRYYVLLFQKATSDHALYHHDVSLYHTFYIEWKMASIF